MKKGNYNVAKQKTTKPICETHVIKKRTDIKESSSEKERKENALALGAEEGRDKLR